MCLQCFRQCALRAFFALGLAFSSLFGLVLAMNVFVLHLICFSNNELDLVLTLGFDFWLYCWQLWIWTLHSAIADKKLGFLFVLLCLQYFCFGVATMVWLSSFFILVWYEICQICPCFPEVLFGFTIRNITILDIHSNDGKVILIFK